jgi:hypothetical protein
MSDIGSLVEALIAAGTPPALAAQIVAQAFAAGVNSTGFRGIPPDSAAEKRRAYDRDRKRKSTGIPPESTGIPNTPLSSSTDLRKRGARLPEDWSPSESDRLFASELGWSESQIDSESANSRDYWIAKPGSGGCKLDWTATWRKWVRSSKIKPVGTVATVRNDAPVDWDSICATYKKFGIWSKHAPGNSPDTSSCRCPPEILAKHGISTETMQ